MPSRPRARVLTLVIALAATLAVSVSPDTTASAVASTTVSCADRSQTTPPVTPALASYAPLLPVPKRIADTRIGLGGHRGVVARGCTMHLDLSNSVVPQTAGAVALSVTALSDERGHVTVYPCTSGRPLASSLNTREDSPTPNLVVAVPDENRDVCLYAHVPMQLVIDVEGTWGAGPNRFTPIDPVRAYDTRKLPGRTPLPAFAVRDVRVAPTYVPAEATSVVVNLTVTETSGEGWLAAYPCGESPPETSNVNYTAGDTRAVAAVVGVGYRNGGSGSICVRSFARTHFVVDVVGYYAPQPDFGPSTEMQPIQQRIVDTRDATGPWDRPFRAGETRELDPLVGVADAADATAVVINAIGLNSDWQGYLTFFPCGTTRPVVSTLNTLPNREATNLLTVKLSPTGSICVYSYSGGDVVLDLVATMSLPKGSPLQSLTIDGADVYPEFTPDGSDYAVKCHGGANRLRVSGLVQRGGAASINGHGLRPDEPVVLDVWADQVFTIDATRSDTSARRYHFRCLPADFPNLHVTQPGEPSPGWYLSGLAGTAGYAVILDERGAPVWYRPTGLLAINPQRLEDGTILYDESNQSGYGTGADEVATNIALDGTVVRTLTTDDPTQFPLDHHELLERPNGWTMLSYELLLHQDLEVLGSGYGDDEYAVDGWIREVATDDPFALQWEWRTSDHFDLAEVQFPVRFNNFLPPEPGEQPEPGEVDLFHLNSVDQVDDGSGDYVVSARHLDAVFRVDRATSNVDWILSSTPAGGFAAPDANASKRLTIIDDPFGGPRRQHDARLDGDVLTLFDNRTGTGEPARAVAYRIDDVAMTATMLWQIQDPNGASSGGLGALRVAPDGSRLVTWGALQPMAQEFDAQGNLLLTISQDPFGMAYRFVKYPQGDFDRNVLRQSAGSAGAPLSTSRLDANDALIQPGEIPL